MPWMRLMAVARRARLFGFGLAESGAFRQDFKFVELGNVRRRQRAFAVVQGPDPKRQDGYLRISP